MTESSFTRFADIKRVKFILKSIQKYIGNSANILDVGCGNGIISKYIGEHGYRLTGIDISPKTIAQARKQNTLPNVNFEVSNAESLTASGQKYEAVVCSEVLEHLHTPGNLLQTLRQILTRNGILIVTVPNGFGPREVLVTKPMIHLQKKQGFAWRSMHKIKQALGYTGTTVQSSADNLDHIQFFSIKKLEELANETGFKIIDVQKSNFIDDIFPVSLVTRRSYKLQSLDGKIADMLPSSMAGGFLTIWKKMEV